MEFVVALLTFVSLMLGVLAFAVRKRERRDQLQLVMEGKAFVKSENSFIQRIEDVLTKILPTQAGVENLERNLRHSGRPFGWDTQDVTVVRSISVVVLAVVSFLVQTSVSGHILIGLVFAVIGYLFPTLMVLSYKSMRQAKIRKQIRSFTMTLALLWGTGIRPEQALQEAITTATGDFQSILKEMQQRMAFNLTLSQGFGWLAEETGLKELERLSMVITNALNNGTQLGFALQSMLREQDAEIKNKAERLAQNVILKVTLIVLFLILGPTIGFDGLLAGVSFFDDFSGF